MIRLARETDMARVDDDQLHSALERGRVREARIGGIVAQRIRQPLFSMSAIAPPALPVATLPTPYA
jgi:hypothetical protein